MLKTNGMETQVIDIVAIQKDLYKTKAVATLIHYDPSNGDLIYHVEALGKVWEFPIQTISATEILVDTNSDEKTTVKVDSIKLSEDLKGANWDVEIKGSILFRWIKQAIKADKFKLALLPENYSGNKEDYSEYIKKFTSLPVEEQNEVLNRALKIALLTRPSKYEQTIAMAMNQHLSK
jgi:hypothetical protein